MSTPWQAPQLTSDRVLQQLLIGRLTQDPEPRALPSGLAVTSFGVTTHRVYTDKEGKKQEEVTFHNVVVFGRLAETAAQYLRRGRMVLVQGSLRNRSWEKDGQKHVRTEIVSERIQFGPKPGKEASEPVTELVADPSEEASSVEEVVGV